MHIIITWVRIGKSQLGARVDGLSLAMEIIAFLLNFENLFQQKIAEKQITLTYACKLV